MRKRKFRTTCVMQFGTRISMPIKLILLTQWFSPTNVSAPLFNWQEWWVTAVTVGSVGWLRRRMDNEMHLSYLLECSLTVVLNNSQKKKKKSRQEGYLCKHLLHSIVVYHTCHITLQTPRMVNDLSLPLTSPLYTSGLASSYFLCFVVRYWGKAADLEKHLGLLTGVGNVPEYHTFT